MLLTGTTLTLGAIAKATAGGILAGVASKIIEKDIK